MTFRERVRRLFGGSNPDVQPSGLGHISPSPDSPTRQRAETTDAKAQATAWLEAFEAGQLNPPADIHDPEGWNTYWRNQFKTGAMEQGFNDMMSSDAGLPGLLAERECQTILCAGNGWSMEAVSLSLLGFQVTSLDIAPVIAETMRQTFEHPEHPLRRIPGFALRDDGSIHFTAPGPIDAELCPVLHRSEQRRPCGGGSLTLATGDLVDPSICPGPFDVVIERRTVQLFPADERFGAIERLTARLADRGMFLSHQHDGGWRPGEDRTHYAAAWLEAMGFVVRSNVTGDDRSAQRLAYLMFSTG
jgi:hypothetical protein